MNNLFSSKKIIIIISIIAALVLAVIAGGIVLAVNSGNGNTASKSTSATTSGSNTKSDIPGDDPSSSSSAPSPYSSGDDSSTSSTSSQTPVIETGGLTAADIFYNLPTAKAGSPKTVSANEKDMSLATFHSLYNAATVKKVNGILETSTTVKPKSGGTAYYVSPKGNDNNSGKSTKEAIQTIEKVNNLPLKSGDVVYFERGYEFRGAVKCTVSGVTYSAYGKGAKPVINVSPFNGIGHGTWEPVANYPNLYKYSENISAKDYDIGTLVFDNKICANKAIARTEKDSSGNTKIFNNTTGKPMDNWQYSLCLDLDFYHEYNSGGIYLYSASGNPAQRFKSIEFNIKQNGFSVGVNNITIDNLHIKHAGAHGVAAGTIKNLTVQNCEFSWIGGSIHTGAGSFGRNYATRFGNAVQIYGGCDGFYVKNNYIHQVYDTGVTFQYSSSGAGDAVMQNVEINNNVITYCGYSFEFFCSPKDGTTRYIKDVNISNNLMWYAGYGFCEQRPDKADVAHIKGWGNFYPVKGYFNITNNLFAISRGYYLQAHLDNELSGPKFTGNTYAQVLNRSLGSVGWLTGSRAFTHGMLPDLKELTGDTKPTVIYITGEKQ